MNKKVLIPLVVVIVLLLGGVTVLYMNLHKQRQENQEMEQLAALDKKEMENEYQQFANQYSEMKTQISNDSIVAQLTAEQEKTQKLLDELPGVESVEKVYVSGSAAEYFYGQFAAVCHIDARGLLVGVAAVFELEFFHFYSPFQAFLFMSLLSSAPVKRSVYLT